MASEARVRVYASHLGALAGHSRSAAGATAEVREGRRKGAERRSCFANEATAGSCAEDWGAVQKEPLRGAVADGCSFVGFIGIGHAQAAEFCLGRGDWRRGGRLPVAAGSARAGLIAAGKGGCPASVAWMAKAVWRSVRMM